MPHRTRVLVVDDDQDMVYSLVALLETEGYNVKGLYSARTIIPDVRDFDPDVNAAQEVRQHRLGRRPMLIALSGEYTKIRDRMVAELSGFDYYLIKPFDTKVLLQLVASYTK